MERLEYTLTQPDLVRYNLHYLSGSEVQRQVIRSLQGSVAVLLLLLAGLQWLHGSIFGGLFLLLLTGPLVAMLPNQVRRNWLSQCEKHVDEAAGRLLPMIVELELRPDGLFSTSPRGESLNWYHAVERIDVTADDTYIYLGGGMAVIIPHDRVAAADRAAFLAELERRRAAAIDRLQTARLQVEQPLPEVTVSAGGAGND